MSILSSLNPFPVSHQNSLTSSASKGLTPEVIEKPKEEKSHKVVEFKPDEPTKYISFSKAQGERFNQLETDHFLSKKYLAHLFGDSFLEDSPHEGWFISDALMHMIQVLKENQISPEITKVITDLESCFNLQGRYMSALRSLNKDNENLAEGIKIKEDLCEQVKTLKIGEKTVFPGGYKGHSVLYEVKRVDELNFNFIVYNTGDGVDKHWSLYEKDGVHKVNAAYKIENIQLENIVENDFLEKILLLKTKASENFGEELYDTLLPELKGERQKAPTDIKEYMVSQRAGTCVWKMLCAYLRYNVPLPQYKYMKLKARLDVFEKWHDLGYSLDFNKTNQRLLNRLIVNYEYASYKRDIIPIEFSREELLVLGLLKVQKTFNHYNFLLSDDHITKTENWYASITGHSIYDDNGYVIRKEFGTVDKC